MGVLRADHPDIMEFVRAKSDGGVLHNFNLSVAATDDFLSAASRGEARERFASLVEALLVEAVHSGLGIEEAVAEIRRRAGEYRLAKEKAEENVK